LRVGWSAADHIEKLLDNLGIARRVEVPHVVAVKYVNGTIFPAANQNVWMIC
jgi:hypothetical protein